jgi:hypothetical protein
MFINETCSEEQIAAKHSGNHGESYWRGRLFAGKIVGYAMGNRFTKNLVRQPPFKAVATKRPGPGLIQYSDRGQYCAYEYGKLMDQFKSLP